MKILLMGPQGCGKGTIGLMLSEKLGIPMLSVGELLRSLTPESPYYETIREQMDKGLLVDDHLVGAILRQETDTPKYSKGYIFDGWARQMDDLKVFDPDFDQVIIMEIPREISIKRVCGRRICSSDGKTYNIYTLPKEELEKCKGELKQREDDDTEESINRRLDIYYSTTAKVIDYFDQQGKTIHVNAEPMPEVIFADIMSKLDVVKSA